jgi:hypothetical protein
MNIDYGISSLNGSFLYRGNLESCLNVAKLVCPNVSVRLEKQRVGDCRADGRLGEWYPSRVKIIIPQPTSENNYVIICESGPEI